MLRAPMRIAPLLFLIACRETPAEPEAGAFRPDASVTIKDAGSDVVEASVPVIGDGGKVGCPWIKDPDNCWRKLVKSISDCYGETKPDGKLGADKKTCKAGDLTVTFKKPVDFSAPLDAVDSDITVRVGDRTCLHRVSKVEGKAKEGTHKETVTFTAPGGEATAVLGPKGFEITCPGGEKLHGLLVEALLSPCFPDAKEGGFPITQYNKTDAGAAELILGGTRAERLFRCAP
jgi:hypothetical protein